MSLRRREDCIINASHMPHYKAVSNQVLVPVSLDSRASKICSLWFIAHVM